jgi:hypothetical protein
MMEAARTSETSVDIQLRTRQYIPENSELQHAHRLFQCTGIILKSSSLATKTLHLTAIVDFSIIEKRAGVAQSV